MILRYEYPNVIVRKRSAIPHWHVPFGLYFVTWRLYDSIPEADVLQLKNLETELALARLAAPLGPSVIAIEREIFRLVERSLDRGSGAAWMKDPAIADLVQGVLERNDGKDYQLITNAVMPTHVHVVFRLLGELDDVLQQWKSVTSHRANRMLKRKGEFWAEDYYDVLIRDSRQLERIVRYVRNNPSRAELMEWRWSKFWPETFAQCI